MDIINNIRIEIFKLIDELKINNSKHNSIIKQNSLIKQNTTINSLVGGKNTISDNLLEKLLKLSTDKNQNISDDKSKKITY
jgi:hypothetical protein